LFLNVCSMSALISFFGVVPFCIAFIEPKDNLEGSISFYLGVHWTAWEHHDSGQPSHDDEAWISHSSSSIPFHAQLDSRQSMWQCMSISKDISHSLDFTAETRDKNQPATQKMVCVDRDLLHSSTSSKF
jgi:hypothetical protein